MKKILCVSDLHGGSEVGIMPRKFYVTNVDGKRRRIIPSDIQYKLIGRWEEMVKEVGTVDMVIANGDLVEGVGRKDRGLGIWTTRLNTQAECAAQLLGQIKVRNNNYIITSGTPYHTDVNPSGDILVAEKLGLGMNHYSPAEMSIKVEGKRIHVSHKVGVSTSMYRATAIFREKVMNILTAEDKRMKYDIIVRSHAHYFIRVEDSNGLAFVTPCWQLRTPYMARIGLGLQPQIGYVLLTIGKNSVDLDAVIYPVKSNIQEVQL